MALNGKGRRAALSAASGEEAQTCGPGPFSMSDETVVRAMMRSAGYERIELRRVDAPVLVGRDVKGAIIFQLAIGPAGEVFRETGDLNGLRKAGVR